ncbi:MAG: hypothetical protein U0N15_04210 [Bifidobacterium choerinum]
MNELLAFAFGGLTACTLMRILLSITHGIQDRRERRHADRRDGSGPR